MYRRVIKRTNNAGGVATLDETISDNNTSSNQGTSQTNGATKIEDTLSPSIPSTPMVLAPVQNSPIDWNTATIEEIYRDNPEEALKPENIKWFNDTQTRYRNGQRYNDQAGKWTYGQKVINPDGTVTELFGDDVDESWWGRTGPQLMVGNNWITNEQGIGNWYDPYGALAPTAEARANDRQLWMADTPEIGFTAKVPDNRGTVNADSPAYYFEDWYRMTPEQKNALYNQFGLVYDTSDLEKNKDQNMKFVQAVRGLLTGQGVQPTPVAQTVSNGQATTNTPVVQASTANTSIPEEYTTTPEQGSLLEEYSAPGISFSAWAAKPENYGKAYYQYYTENGADAMLQAIIQRNGGDTAWLNETVGPPRQTAGGGKARMVGQGKQRVIKKAGVGILPIVAGTLGLATGLKLANNIWSKNNSKETEQLPSATPSAVPPQQTETNEMFKYFGWPEDTKAVGYAVGESVNLGARPEHHTEWYPMGHPWFESNPPDAVAPEYFYTIDYSTGDVVPHVNNQATGKAFRNSKYKISQGQGKKKSIKKSGQDKALTKSDVAKIVKDEINKQKSSKRGNGVKKSIRQNPVKVKDIIKKSKKTSRPVYAGQGKTIIVGRAKKKSIRGK